MKDIVLTRGDLGDMRKRSKKHGRKKVYREKTAEDMREDRLRIHPKSVAKMKARIKELTSRSNGWELYPHQNHYHGTSQVSWLRFLFGLLQYGEGCFLRNRRIRDPYVRWCERSENEIGGNLFHFPPTRLCLFAESYNDSSPHFSALLSGEHFGFVRAAFQN